MGGGTSECYSGNSKLVRDGDLRVGDGDDEGLGREEVRGNVGHAGLEVKTRHLQGNNISIRF